MIMVAEQDPGHRQMTQPEDVALERWTVLPTNVGGGEQGVDRSGLESEPITVTVEVGELVAVPGLQRPGPWVNPLLESSPDGGHRVDPQIPARQPGRRDRCGGAGPGY